VVAEIVGDMVDFQLHDQEEKCSDLVAALEIPKPWVLRVDTMYSRLRGHAISACIFLRFDGTIYDRCTEYHWADSGARALCSPNCAGWEGVEEYEHNWRVTPGQE
jgi:hypothetical protein